MSDYTDQGIPTLTQRADLSPASARATPSENLQHSDDDLPVLTDIADTPDWDDTVDMVSGADTSHAALSTTSTHSTPTATVLRAALQAELEQALNDAVEEVSARLRARLEAELPALIDRAVSKVRPG